MPIILRDTCEIYAVEYIVKATPCSYASSAYVQPKRLHVTANQLMISPSDESDQVSGQMISIGIESNWNLGFPLNEDLTHKTTCAQW